MATTAGSIQKNGQIQWIYSMSGVAQSSSRISISVDAYFASVAPYSQYYTGTKSWSGTWGSGSSGQAYNLPAGARVRLVYSPSVSVVLTDSTQTVSFAVTAQHFFGATTSTLTLSVPPRYAGTPSGLTITRNSDTSHRLNWSRNSTYSAVVVQRSVNGGAWSQVARPSGNAATWTDTSTRAGNQYRYRVAGIGGSGQSGWSNTATVYTSPNTPTGPSASREGNNIVVDVSGKPAYATGYNIRDGATQVASNVQLPWTHVSPAPANTHTYTVQAVRGSLTSGWSSASNTVQLISQPLAPTRLAPNGAVSVSDAATVLRWKHNPVDSSAQSAGEVRYRVKGVTAWTTRTVTTAQQFSVALDAAEYEWQARTKGAHPDWSPWSAIASATVIDRPGVAVTQPGEVWTKRTVTATWSWSQGQGRPQSGWEAELHSPDGMLERRVGSGAGRSVAFTTKLVDGVEYEVLVKAASGDVWSDPAAQSFYVQVPPAAPADMDGVWSEESGAVTVDVQDGRGEVRAAVTNHFTRPRLTGSGSWAVVRRNFAKNASFTTLDRPLTLTGGNMSSGGGAVLTVSDEWGRHGSTSLMVSGSGIASSAYMGVNNPNDGMSLDVWGGRTLTVSVDIRLTGPNGATASTNNGARSIEIGHNIGGVTTWRAFSSAPAPDRAGVSRLSVTFTLPVGTSSDWWILRLFNGSPTGVPVWFDGLLIEEAGVALPYFSGGTSDYVLDGDARYRYDGTGGATVSESIKEVETVTGITGVNCVVAATTRDEKPAMRIIATSPTAAAYARYDMPATAIRDGGYLLATKHQDGPLDTAYTGTLGRLQVGSPNQAAPTPPNEAGSWDMRVDFSGLDSLYRVYFGGGMYIGEGDVWYTDIALFEHGYSGPVFDGSSGLVQVGESWMGASWDGAPDNSTSTLRMAPAAVRADVERSVDGGLTWVPFIEGADLPVLETDTEALSNGITLYRVTTYSADDATSVVIHEVESDSPAVWLSGGDGYTHTARLPYDPDVSITRGRERAVRRYAGRPKPVVHAGEAVTRTVDYSGTLLLDEQSPDELADLVADETPVHLYRDPDGRHIYGAVGDVQLTRESHAHWGFGFQLTETDQ